MNQNHFKNDDIAMRDILEQVDTPECDISGAVLKQLHAAPPVKRPRINRALAIAAAIVSMAILMSAGVAIYNQMVYYDTHGNKREMPDDIIFHNPGSEEFEFEQSLRKNMEECEILFMTAPSSPRFYVKPIKISDYGELTNYLQNNGGEQLSLPGYVPQGYELDYAEVYVNLSGDADYREFEPVYYEEKYGTVYEIYKLPEEQSKVEHVSLHYFEGKKDRMKGYIAFHMSFAHSGGDKTFGSSAAGNTESEVFEMPQFTYALMLSYELGKNRGSLQRMFIAEKPIERPVSILNVHFISKAWREANAVNFAWDSYSFDAIVYNIISTSISREEIIKMAESIK